MTTLQLSGILISDNRLSLRSWTYVVWLLAFIPIGYVALYFAGDTEKTYLALHAVYFTMVLGHIGYRTLTSGISSIIAPDVLFAMAFTLVNWGMITTLWTGLAPQSGIELRFEETIPKSLNMTIIGLAMFLATYEMLGESKAAAVFRHQRVIRSPRQGWAFLGVTLFTSGVIMHLLGLVGLGPDVLLRDGYAAIQVPGKYTNSAITRILLSMSIPISAIGIFTYTATSTLKHGRLFRSKTFLLFWLGWVVVILLEGDRGGALKLTLPAILLQHFIIKPIKFRYLFAIGLSATILFSALAFVRKSTSFSPQQMLSEYLHSKESNPGVSWYSVAYEVGYSFQILNITVHEVPSSEPYWAGDSWRDAVIHIIPFAQGFAQRQGWSTWDPGQWVTISYYGSDSAGKGYNAVAEGYLNFGAIGVLIQMGMLGALLRWLVRQFRNKPSTHRLIIMVGGLAPTILIIRNHTNLLFAPMTQLIVYAYILNWLLGSDLRTVGLTPPKARTVSNEAEG